jgi:hypothetical protein
MKNAARESGVWIVVDLAGPTGLEPPTSGLTRRRSAANAHKANPTDNSPSARSPAQDNRTALRSPH